MYWWTLQYSMTDWQINIENQICYTFEYGRRTCYMVLIHLNTPVFHHNLFQFPRKPVTFKGTIQTVRKAEIKASQQCISADSLLLYRSLYFSVALHVLRLVNELLPPWQILRGKRNLCT